MSGGSPRTNPAETASTPEVSSTTVTSSCEVLYSCDEFPHVRDRLGLGEREPDGLPSVGAGAGRERTAGEPEPHGGGGHAHPSSLCTSGVCSHVAVLPRAIVGDAGMVGSAIRFTDSNQLDVDNNAGSDPKGQDPCPSRLHLLPSRRASLDAVLAYAWDIGVFTASEAMSAVGLTRSTTIDVLDELVELGLLRELPERPRGRRVPEGPARAALRAARATPPWSSASTPGAPAHHDVRGRPARRGARAGSTPTLDRGARLPRRAPGRRRGGGGCRARRRGTPAGGRAGDLRRRAGPGEPRGRVPAAPQRLLAAHESRLRRALRRLGSDRAGRERRLARRRRRGVGRRGGRMPGLRDPARRRAPRRGGRRRRHAAARRARRRRRDGGLRSRDRGRGRLGPRLPGRPVGAGGGGRRATSSPGSPLARARPRRPRRPRRAARRARAATPTRSASSTG